MLSICWWAQGHPLGHRGGRLPVSISPKKTVFPSLVVGINYQYLFLQDEVSEASPIHAGASKWLGFLRLSFRYPKLCVHVCNGHTMFRGQHFRGLLLRPLTPAFSLTSLLSCSWNFAAGCVL